MSTTDTHSENPAYRVNYSPQLQERLQSALLLKGQSYQPRTRHQKNGQPSFTNRLIFSDSPYLLQHAHNPVDWYPWGDEAFATAEREQKPIFLSIGYATCHWCHVMEEESFESIDVARILNEHFIAIKVDREQYPDVDSAYMTAVTLLTGRGGWPMSSFLTAAGKPFYGGTYYPRPTFIDLLSQIHTAWTEQPQTVRQQADRLAEAVANENTRHGIIADLEASTVRSAVQQILRGFDRVNGGFSPAPKFPNEPLLLLLLQIADRINEPAVMQALDKSLSAMAQGGIYDQIGGGFHRYSTDDRWLVPHFEKMLYNQAYLARVYLRAYRLTSNALYARVVRQTLDYVLREMVTTNGLFYSATDADSEGEEGTYFVWTLEEIKTVLAADDAELIIRLFGLSRQGNFEGKNIFFLKTSLAETAQELSVSLAELCQRLDPILDQLRTYRAQRVPPLTDDKIIVAWNAMLITALAEAGDMLDDSRYVDAAVTAADALWRMQREAPGKLWRISLGGTPSISARQDDYAHFIEAVIALYDMMGEQRYLQYAEQLCDEMLEKFLDPASGAMNMGGDPLLFTQPKDAYDGALPSGNAVAVRLFNRLFRRTGKQHYQSYASKILQAFSTGIVRHPPGYAYMLAQLDEQEHGETGHRQYAASGAIKITLHSQKQHDGGYALAIDFSIQPGWHINANEPAQASLTTTTIDSKNPDLWRLESVNFPPAEKLSVTYSPDTVAVFQGQFSILAEAKAVHPETVAPLTILIRLQACNQKQCFAAESLTLTARST